MKPGLDRNVALKILAPGLAADDAFRKRFIRESRIAAAVDHPNIIPVFDAGEANGVLFIAMRFVHGRDVRTLLDTEGPLPAARAIDIVIPGGVGAGRGARARAGAPRREAGQHAARHDRGRRAAGPRLPVRLRAQQADATNSARPASPPRASSSAPSTTWRPSRSRAAGRRPRRPVRAGLRRLRVALRRAPVPRDAGLAVVWAKLSESPPLLSTRRADLPGAVDGVMSRAMAKEPDDRFPSCGEFAAALRDACGLGPAAPRPPARPPRQATQIAMPIRPPAAERPPAR